MRAWTATAATVLLVGLAWFGRSAWGGWFLVDESPSMDIYHLSTLYERWAHYLLAGEFPSWMPEFAGGFPAPASWMYGLYSPGNLLFAVLPADAAWTWTALLHMVLGAVGVHLLVRAETGDAVAAATAGLVFGLSEFLIGRALYGHLNVLAPVAWVPWVFLHVRGMAQGRRGAAAWCVVSATLGLLAGHVQVWFYAVPALLAYALVLGRGAAAGRRRFALRLGGVGLIVALLTAVQWLPTLELTLLSRGATATGAGVLDFSAPLHVLVAKLFPGALGRPGGSAWGPETAGHEFVAIGGLYLLVLALPALLRGRGDDGARRTWFWAGVAALGLLLAPGVHNPLSDLLNALPPFRWGRTPARALLLTTLAGAILAGRGVAEWRRIARDTPGALRRTATITGVATLVTGTLGAAALFVLLRDDGIGDHAPLVVRAIVTSLGLAGIALAVLLLARRQARLWFALPAIAVAAAFLGGVPPARTVPAAFFSTDWASIIPAPLARHRLHLLSGRLPNVERQGLRTLREICYVDAYWFHEFTADPTPQRGAWLDIGAELTGIPRERVMTGKLGPDDLIGKPLNAIGPGLVFDGARVEPRAARVLDVLDTGARTLFLAAEAEGAGDAASRPVTGARVTRVPAGRPARDPNQVVLDVETPIAGWLFVSEKYYPGWTATVNDAPARIHRANVTFRAVRVPQGRSRVVFDYRPAMVRWGLLLGGAGLLLALLGAMLPFIARRRRSA